MKPSGLSRGSRDRKPRTRPAARPARPIRQRAGSARAAAARERTAALPRPEARDDRERESAIVGRHPVREALRARQPVNRLLVQEGLDTTAIRDILQLAREQRVPVSSVPRVKLDGLTEGRPHQGLAALLAAAAFRGEEDLEDLVAAANGPPFWIILDGVQDPQNLGAILRVADGAGAHGVIVPARGASGLTTVVAKASAGAHAWVPVVRVTNVARAVERLQSFGIFVWAAAPDGEEIYTGVDWTGASAVIVGGEGHGVRPLVRRRADGSIRLPMAGRLESLNVATAAAVLAFEVGRQRRILVP